MFFVSEHLYLKLLRLCTCQPTLVSVPQLWAAQHCPLLLPGEAALFPACSDRQIISVIGNGFAGPRSRLLWVMTGRCCVWHKNESLGKLIAARKFLDAVFTKSGLLVPHNSCHQLGFAKGLSEWSQGRNICSVSNISPICHPKIILILQNCAMLILWHSLKQARVSTPRLLPCIPSLTSVQRRSWTALELVYPYR